MAQKKKPITHYLQWLGIKTVMGILRLLPMDTASNAMGWLGRNVGPKLRVTRVAERNLRASFPEWNDAQIRETIAGMWDNMARYIGEFPHVAPLTADEFRERCEIVGIDNLLMAQTLGKGTLFFSCHMANWELAAKASWAVGVLASVVYRPLNNRLVDKMVNAHRDQYQLKGLPKTPQGGRELLMTLKRGNPVAILADQKLSGGIHVPFFGRPAKTGTSIADLALKYNYPVLPARVERIGNNGAQFRVTYYPPLEITNTDTVESILLKMHEHMETWIRERPDQWFWVHKRWG